MHIIGTNDTEGMKIWAKRKFSCPRCHECLYRSKGFIFFKIPTPPPSPPPNWNEWHRGHENLSEAKIFMSEVSEVNIGLWHSRFLTSLPSPPPNWNEWHLGHENLSEAKIFMSEESQVNTGLCHSRFLTLPHLQIIFRRYTEINFGAA